MTDRADLDRLRARLEPPGPTGRSYSAATGDAMWQAVEAADEFKGSAARLLTALDTGEAWAEAREAYVRAEDRLNATLAVAMRAYREEEGART